MFDTLANLFSSPTLNAVAVVVLGALFNAHLNRRRDDRLRAEDLKATAIALRAELSTIRETLARNATTLSADESKGHDFTGPDINNQVKIFPALLSKLPLLDGDTLVSVMDSYAVIAQYIDTLILLGARPNKVEERRIFTLPGKASATVVNINTDVADRLTKTMALLTSIIDSPCKPRRAG